MKIKTPRFLKAARAGGVSFRDCLLVLGGAAVVLLGMGTAGVIRAHKTPIPAGKNQLTTAWLPPTVIRWKEPITKYAKQYNIDPNLIAILMTMESGGDPKAESEAGAKGLMQVTPPTAADIAKKHLKHPRDSYDLFDPQTNIEFGTAYLAWLRDEFGTPAQGPSWVATVELVAAGYNGGPGAANRVEQGKGLEDTQTVIYARDAFNMWRERVSAKSPTYDRWVERGGSTLLTAAEKN